MTNDGDLASKLTHPSFKKKKIYHVWLDKNVAIEDMEKITSILRRKNRSDVAEQLREIWRKVLNADDSLDIEAETNFFEAGGDSLLLGLLNIMIEKQIGRKLRIETFFEHQTFGGMVRAIQAEPAV